MTWREVLPGPFRPTHGFELSWSMLKTWPVRAEALLESGVPSLAASQRWLQLWMVLPVPNPL